MIRAIEDLGFDSIWLGEHLLYRWADRPPRGPWEAWTMLAAIAAVTTRGSSSGRSSPAPTSTTRPCWPSRPRRSTRSAAVASILGLGAGWNETEFRAYGFPYDHRVERFEEAFTIIRSLLRDGAVDFDGRWYQVRDCELLPRGPRPGGPPLMIGSNGPRMLRATLPYVDSWNVWFAQTGQPARTVCRPLRELVDATCREVGRDPAEVERTVAVLVRLPGGSGRLQGDDATDPTPPLEGSPAEMAEVLRGVRRRGDRPRPARRRPDHAPVDPGPRPGPDRARQRMRRPPAGAESRASMPSSMSMPPR